MSLEERAQLHQHPVREIVEEGVASIELVASSTFNRNFIPADGRVKWFKDELDQRWVKFSTHRKSGGMVQHVCPADRVVEVTYDKST